MKTLFLILILSFVVLSKDDYYYYLCPDCKGYQYIVCVFCGGDGCMQTCGRCRGVGWYKVYSAFSDGKYRREVCEVCKGKKCLLQCFHCGGKGIKLCKKCSGKGFLKKKNE